MSPTIEVPHGHNAGPANWFPKKTPATVGVTGSIAGGGTGNPNRSTQGTDQAAELDQFNT